MITKKFVEEIKHIINWFVNVYGQYNDLFYFQWGRLDTLSYNSWNPILDTLLWKSWQRPCFDLNKQDMHNCLPVLTHVGCAHDMTYITSEVNNERNIFELSIISIPSIMNQDSLLAKCSQYFINSSFTPSPFQGHYHYLIEVGKAILSLDYEPVYKALKQ